MDDRLLRRAGLDYHETASVQRHTSWSAFISAAKPNSKRSFALTTKATRTLADIHWQPDDWMVFGSETSGLPAAVREFFVPSQHVRLPMRPGQRSLNLSNAVAVTVFEAWRQCGYQGAA